MIKSLRTASVIFFFSFCMIASAFAQVTVDEEKLREFVIQVMKENPQLVFELYNQYASEMRAQQEDRQLDASFANRIEDTVSESNPVKGPADAPVTIIEYSDFECPYCARGANTAARTLQMFPGKVRLAFKNNPLEFHKQALPAAKAALAARKQGKFWEYHDRLFANSKKLNDELYTNIAKELELDLERFETDRNSEEIAKQIESDQARAKELKLGGTPAFLINGVHVRGAKPIAHFQKVIERLLAEQEKPEDDK